MHLYCFIHCILPDQCMTQILNLQEENMFSHLKDYISMQISHGEKYGLTLAFLTQAINFVT